MFVTCPIHTHDFAAFICVRCRIPVFHVPHWYFVTRLVHMRDTTHSYDSYNISLIHVCDMTSRSGPVVIKKDLHVIKRNRRVIKRDLNIIKRDLSSSRGPSFEQ